MATSQARAGPGLERISRSLAHKVITITVRLKQQNVTNPVVRETDSSFLKKKYFIYRFVHLQRIVIHIP